MGPRFPRLGAVAFAATYPLVRLAGALDADALADRRLRAGADRIDAAEARARRDRLRARHRARRPQRRGRSRRRIERPRHPAHRQPRRGTLPRREAFSALPGHERPGARGADEATGHRARADSRGVRELGLSVLDQQGDRERGAGAAGQPAALRARGVAADERALRARRVQGAAKAGTPPERERRPHADRQPASSRQSRVAVVGRISVREMRRARDGAGDRRRRRRRRDLHLRRRARLAPDAVPKRQHLGFAGDDVRHPELVAGRVAAPEQRRPVHGRGRVGRLEPAHQPLLRSAP